MVDNIKIWVKLSGKQQDYGNAQKKGNNSKYERHYKIPSPHVNGKPLDMSVNYYPSTNHSTLEINGSWRKWYLGAGTSRDLSHKNYVRCIKAIAKQISVPVENLRNADIKKVEVGVGLRFKKNMDGVINGFVFFNNFDPIYQYGRESVKFSGSHYSVAFYDKSSQIMKEKERQKKGEEQLQARKGLYPKQKRKPITELAKKINKNNFLLRYEVRVTELNACPPEFMTKDAEGEKICMIKTPKDISENWDSILNGLDKIFCSVTFSTYNLNAGLNFLNNKGITEFEMYEPFLAAASVGGVRNYLSLLKRLNSNHRKKHLKKRIKLLENPPKDLKPFLKACKNKTELLYTVKDERISKLKKKVL